MRLKTIFAGMTGAVVVALVGCGGSTSERGHPTKLASYYVHRAAQVCAPKCHVVRVEHVAGEAWLGEVRYRSGERECAIIQLDHFYVDADGILHGITRVPC